ncbi:hypothetical protein IG631_22194 [Alternaria alternata]|nr:hypothetical protein IG631_22194 [Alternaria alternata]
MEANQLGHRACAARTRLTGVLSALSKLVLFPCYDTNGNGVGDGWWADCGRQGWRNVVIGTRESCGKKRRIHSDDLARAMASAFNALHRNPYRQRRRKTSTHPTTRAVPPLRSTQANTISPPTDTPYPRTTTASPSTKPPSTVSSPPVSAV